MRIVIVSDTHGHHESLGTLEGDVLIHCGDSQGGHGRDPTELRDFDDWLGRQRFEAVLCVGGNHDFAMERQAQSGETVLRNATYLEDETVELGGLRFHGAPWVPMLRGWAYYEDDAAIRGRWATLPEGLDVLITHTPPAGILDRNSGGMGCGCPELARALAWVKPRVHCFGHIHASRGRLEQDGTTFINAAQMSRSVGGLLPPMVLEL